MTYVLTALLALATGWCWGHATARVRVVFIGATPAEDQAAIDQAEELFVARFRAELDDADSPFAWDDPDHDQPGSSAA